MDSLISMLRDIDGKEWSAQVLLPAFFLTGLLGLSVIEATVGWDQAVIWWRSYSIETQSLVLMAFAAFGLVVALVFDLNRERLFALFIGVRWRQSIWRLAYSNGMSLQTRRQQLLIQQYSELASQSYPPSDVRQSRQAWLEEELRHMPMEAQNVQPTSAGNALAAAAEYAGLRYGLDYRATWLLVFATSGEVLRNSLQETRRYIDLHLRLAVCVFAAAGAQLTVSLLLLHWLRVGLILVAAAAGLFALHVAVNIAAREFGELIRAVFDTTHQDFLRLYSDIIPPDTDGDARTTGRRISEFLWRGTK